MEMFVITQLRNGDFQFDLKFNTGKTLLNGDGYPTIDCCINAIETVQRNSLNQHCFEKINSDNSSYYFILKSINGHIIGRSENFENQKRRDKIIEIVQKTAVKAKICIYTTY